MYVHLLRSISGKYLWTMKTLHAKGKKENNNRCRVPAQGAGKHTCFNLRWIFDRAHERRTVLSLNGGFPGGAGVYVRLLRPISSLGRFEEQPRRSGTITSVVSARGQYQVGVLVDCENLAR